MSGAGVPMRKFLVLIVLTLLTFAIFSRNLYPKISYFRDTAVVIIDRSRADQTIKDNILIDKRLNLDANSLISATSLIFKGSSDNAYIKTDYEESTTGLSLTTADHLANQNQMTTESEQVKSGLTFNINTTLLQPDFTLTPMVKRLIPNKSPVELIKCNIRLMEPYIAKLIKYRDWARQHPHPWRPYTEAGYNNTVYAENTTYFSTISHFTNIQTFFFNETVERASECLINDGMLHYDYGINNCSSVLDKAKRYTMYGKNLYDMHCFKKQEMSLTLKSLNDAAFRVGLPENFVHSAGTKTLTYIHMIRDATVTVYGDVTTANVTLIPQRCFQDVRIPLPEDPETLPLYDEVFSMSQYYGKGMFHANIEDISRLAPYIHFLKMYPNIKIHVYDLELPPVYLSMIDLDPKRFINGTVRANILYMPSGVNCCLPPLYGTQIESFYLRKNLPNVQGEGRDTIVIVKRRNRRGRYFENHRQIADLARKKAKLFGLNVWEFTDSPLPTLEETALQFNRAFMVIAPHGAGESNLIFTQPGTILLEGLCVDRHDGLINVVFRTLSHLLGGFYYGFFKQDDHCTATTAQDLAPYLDFYFERLDEFRF